MGEMIDVEAMLREGPADQGDLASDVAAAVQRADQAGVVDVAWGTVESPVGPLVAAVTPKGLAMLSFWSADEALEDCARRLSVRVVAEPKRVDPVRRELDEYFARRRREFELTIDWSLTAGFQRRILQATAKIPYGALRTYRDMATAAGNAAATRAAGNALGSNPVPVVVPCHRVVRTGGGLGGYGGGLDRKRLLLDLESEAALDQLDGG